MNASDVFSGCLISEDFSFERFGRVEDHGGLICTYAYDKNFITQMNNNPDIVGVVTTEEFAEHVNPRIRTVVAEAPASIFFGAYNAWVELQDKRMPATQIDDTADIENGAFVSSHGVVVGKRTRIERGAIIKQGVSIGDDCIIRSGAVIGGQGFEVKTLDGHPQVINHGDRVIIGSNVEIQYNTCVDRGFLGRDTILESGVKIDNLVHVAHGVHIGENTKIAAGTTIAGRASIGKSVWIGPGSTISNAVTIQDGGYVTLGSTVVMDVKSNTKVTGFFAIEHTKFFAAWRRFRSAK